MELPWRPGCWLRRRKARHLGGRNHDDACPALLSWVARPERRTILHTGPLLLPGLRPSGQWLAQTAQSRQEQTWRGEGHGERPGMHGFGAGLEQTCRL